MVGGLWVPVSRLANELWVPQGLSLVGDKELDISSRFFLHTFDSRT